MLRFSDDGTQKVLLDNTYDQQYSFDHDRDSNIFSYQYNFLKTSYQNWVSFLMTIGYDSESYADILNPVRIFNDLLPHNSFIIKYPAIMIEEDQGYDLKNRYLESIYFHCQEYEEKFIPEVTALSQNFNNEGDFNEIALATNDSQFNHASQFNLQNYQRILNCAYLFILKSLECSANQARSDEDTEVRQIEKKANILIFKHFYLKEDYNKFFNISEHEMQLACGRVFSYLFNLEPYRKLLIEVSEFTTAELVEFIKIKDFSTIQNQVHKTQLEGLNQKYLQIQEIFKIVLAYFKKENSFERQYFHAINSDPLIVSNLVGIHYTSYIASTKIQNPFPEHDSLQSLYLQSLSTKDFKEEISQTLSHFIDREANKLNLQSLSARPDSASQFPSPPSIDLSPSSSPTINIIQQSSSLFQKLKGRQDDNLRYRVSEGGLDNEPIHERISRAIEQSKLLNSADAVTQEISENEILLAMLLAKNFGGIGTKIDQIFPDKSIRLDQERQALVGLLNIRNPDGTNKINRDLFNKLVNFSANFQIKCKESGIYSGNTAINEKDLLDQTSIQTRHGLRLAFIPDEFLLEYLNKPLIEKKYKDVAKNLIAKNIKQRQSPSQQAGRC